MKKRKDKLVSIYLMFGLILLVIGFSYAFFIYNKTGLYTHTITGGKMKVIYDETTGNNITIENAYPRTDKEAESKALEFEFTITGYNESDKNVYYAIEIDHGEDVTGKNRFLDSDMKLTLYENEELIFENEIFENLDNQDIHYNYFKSGTNSQTPAVNNYKMRLWINDNVYISDTFENDINQWNDEDWFWASNNLDSDEYRQIEDGEVNYLNDLGMSVYTSDGFANSYANFKVNVRADLTYDDIGYLTYDANGGEFTPKKTSLLTGRITQQKPVMEDKGFLGWSSNPNAIKPEYKAGDYYSGSGQVLYAVYSDTRNVMGTFPEEMYNIINTIKLVKEVQFINDTQENIDERYSVAQEERYAVDLTLDNQGSVKAWIEEYFNEGLDNEYYKLYIGSEGTTYLTDCSYMFFDLYTIENIDFSNVDTSMVENMEVMFGVSTYTSSLETLDLSSFDTSNVVNMKGMFGAGYDYGRLSIEELDLSNFDTSKVTDMSYMFSNCENLIELDLSSFDTSNVTNMDSMFWYCESLVELDLSNFDTSKVTDMSSMFEACTNLTQINLSSFDTRNVTTMYRMFLGLDKITSLDLNNFDTSNVTDMYQMFYGCSLIEFLDLTNFDTSAVTTMHRMFEWCSKLRILDLSSFSFDNVTTPDIFYNVGSELPNGILTIVYVKSINEQMWILNLSSSSYYRPASWTTNNVIVKNS